VRQTAKTDKKVLRTQKTGMEINVALAGNPNVGKTSIFNRLTNSFAHVGNWHGVTSEKLSRRVESGGRGFVITDLPGLYSLTVYSPEEAAARDALLSAERGLTVSVCETGNLARNLYLTLQLLEAGLPTVLAINMADELKKRGGTLDISLLAARLGVPAVMCSAKTKAGTRALSDAITACGAAAPPRPPYLDKLPAGRVAAIVAERARAAGIDPIFAAVKLLERDAYIEKKLRLPEAQRRAVAECGDLRALVAKLRYDYIDGILNGVITGGPHISGASRLDKIFLNKYLALPVLRR
jgi:ferrous iron transport protein B